MAYYGNPAAHRRANIKKRYGISLDDYDRMLEEQGNRCGICGTDTPRGHGHFHIDHCHDSGKIRGLLCHSCNTALGGFKDSISLLASAIQYLSEHEPPINPGPVDARDESHDQLRRKTPVAGVHQGSLQPQMCLLRLY